ncbi:MAG TPA: hypothetical protein DEF00_00430, partial [Candidatus Taylorbacteria bacterium]|nr:hypothetical protein [Candidatus Taylorbacteria bacterium]
LADIPFVIDNSRHIVLKITYQSRQIKNIWGIGLAVVKKRECSAYRIAGIHLSLGDGQVNDINLRQILNQRFLLRHRGESRSGENQKSNQETKEGF